MVNKEFPDKTWPSITILPNLQKLPLWLDFSGGKTAEIFRPSTQPPILLYHVSNLNSCFHTSSTELIFCCAFKFPIFLGVCACLAAFVKKSIFEDVVFDFISIS